MKRIDLSINTVRMLNDDKGFTLVELVVALVMAMVLIGGVMAVTQMSSRTYRGQERISDAQQGVRGGIDAMVRDIRMAGYDPRSYSSGPSTGVGITQANATSFRFTADRNASGVIEATIGDREEITFHYNPADGKLYQTRYETAGGGTSSITESLVDDVSNLTFTYFDEAGATTSVLSDIALVVVNMTVSVKDGKGTTVDRTLVTRINCRNLRIRNDTR